MALPSLRFRYGQFLTLLKRRAQATPGSCSPSARSSRARFNPYAGYQLAGVWHRLGRRDELRAEYERIRMEFGLQPK